MTTVGVVFRKKKDRTRRGRRKKTARRGVVEDTILQSNDCRLWFGYGHDKCVCIYALNSGKTELYLLNDIDIDSKEEGERERLGGCNEGLLSFRHSLHHRRERDDDSTKLLQQPFQTALCYLSSFTAIGSTIYCLRNEELSNEVFYFNIGSDDLKACPPMINRRFGARTVTVILDGKLYVLGGYDTPTDDDLDSSWAEVFDPVQGQWTSLPPPPSYLTPGRGGLFAAAVDYGHDSKKKVLVVGSSDDKVLYAYDVGDNDWKTLFNGDFHYSYGPVVVGSTLYWIDNELHAYDFDQGKHCSGPIQDMMIQGLIKDEEISSTKCLFHLAGDDFCFLWESVYETFDNCVHCTRLRVSKGFYPSDDSVNGEEYLIVSVVSCRYYFFPPTTYFRGGMLLDGLLGGMKELGGESTSEDWVEKKLGDGASGEFLPDKKKCIRGAAPLLGHPEGWNWTFSLLRRSSYLCKEYGNYGSFCS